MVKLHKIPGVRYVPQIEYRPAKSALWALAIAVIGYTSLTISFGASRDDPSTEPPAPAPPPATAAVEADINADGIVDAADMSIMLNEWGAAGGRADLDGDGDVDVADMSALMSQWPDHR